MPPVLRGFGGMGDDVAPRASWDLRQGLWGNGGRWKGKTLPAACGFILGLTMVEEAPPGFCSRALGENVPVGGLICGQRNFLCTAFSLCRFYKHWASRFIKTKQNSKAQGGVATSRQPMRGYGIYKPSEARS